MNINEIKFRIVEKSDIDYIMEIEQSSFFLKLYVKIKMYFFKESKFLNKVL